MSWPWGSHKDVFFLSENTSGAHPIQYEMRSAFFVFYFAMFRPFSVILCALVLSVMSACTSDVVPIYSSQPAFLRYAPVPTAPPLLSALTSPGQWCSITYTHLQINISAPGHTTITTPATALDVYGRPRSIAGFIVGTPSLPEATGLHEARAYDLVCPSCYRTLSIARALTLSATAPDRADCPRCARRYNLATGTQENAPKDNQDNASLYRYRLAYNPAQGVMVIQN